jgi:hypothetical protein
MKFIIVSSHPRSGTHFLINSLLASYDKFYFPEIRPSFLTFENLMLSHDQDIYKLWKNTIKIAKKKKIILIFKTHCTKLDILNFITKEKVFVKEAQLIKFIYNNSLILNIQRNPTETLRSWYFFAKQNEIISINGTYSRHKNLSFTEFLRLKNLHKVNTYKTYDHDENIVKYLFFHHQNWKKKSKIIFNISYEDLKNDYFFTMDKIFNFLNKNKLRNFKNNQKFKKPKQVNESIANNILLRVLKKIKLFNRFYKFKNVYNKTEYTLNINKSNHLFIKNNYN